MWPKAKFDKQFQQVVPCESTGREVSFEWSHHRILSTDSKIRATLQNCVNHSGNDRAKPSGFKTMRFRRPDSLVSCRRKAVSCKKNNKISGFVRTGP